MEGTAPNTCPAASSIRHGHQTFNPQSKPRPLAGVTRLRRWPTDMKTAISTIMAATLALCAIAAPAEDAAEIDKHQVIEITAAELAEHLGDETAEPGCLVVGNGPDPEPVQE
mgnify:CR=1 FL=1